MTDRQARMISSGLVVLTGGVLFGAGVLALGFGQRQVVPDSCQFFGAVVFAIGAVMLLADWVGSWVADLGARLASRKALPAKGSFPVVPIEPADAIEPAALVEPLDERRG